MSHYINWIYRVAAETNRGTPSEDKALDILSQIYCDRTKATIWAEVEAVRIQLGQLAN